ncbi:5'-methylthioadenosine/S-adenosylhomocysteine nucleosidase 2 [Setaria italica]|nr:5'-methylthioadenosine/S-adenosylhomocysteine nucleosidase 2 [Setaria italica]
MSESPPLPHRDEPTPSKSRHDSPPKSSPLSTALPLRHVYTRRRGHYHRSQVNQGEDMGPDKEERQPTGGGASQAARSSVGPDSTPPADQPIISEMDTGSPLWRLSLGTGSSPTCQRRPASPPRTIRLLGFELPAMAPPPPSEQPDAPAAGAGAISKVLIVMAMETEATPLVNKFRLVEAPAHESIFPKGATWTRFYGNYKDLHLDLVMPGKDVVFGVDSVGTVSASLVAYASIQALKPDLIINAGTAGGFKTKGASVGDVFLASDVAFHDRRIPIPVFDMYGVGARKTFAAPNILKELNFKLGKLSTGDSLDMSPQDEEMILKNDATVKDMEGAAVAYVADIFSTPAIFVKAVTDIVDGEKPTAEEFLQNLISVTAALDVAVTKMIDFISGKRITDL